MDSDFTLYDGKFEYLINSDGKSWKLEWKGKYQPFPSFVYKYFPLGAQSVESLLNGQFFAAMPESMNDLFDSAFHAIPLEISDVDFFKKIFPSNEQFDPEKFKNSEGYRLQIRNTIYAFFNQLFGILSTTSDCLNDLMWSHYSKNDGFCVKYDYRKFPAHFGEPIPVSYLDQDDFLNIKEDEIVDRFLFNWLRKKKYGPMKKKSVS